MIEKQCGAGYMGQIEDGRILVWNSVTGKSYLIGAGQADEEVNYWDYPLASSVLEAGVEHCPAILSSNQFLVERIFRVRRLHWACPMHIRPGYDMTPARRRPYKINLDKGV